MANRNTLHRSKLDGFKRWLEQDGWDLQPAKGDYEVLRAARTAPVVGIRQARR